MKPTESLKQLLAFEDKSHSELVAEIVRMRNRETHFLMMQDQYHDAFCDEENCRCID